MIQHFQKAAHLDLLRAAVVVSLPFVTAVWQIYLLIFLLNACSAGFTPVFQATIPDIFEDERRYTQALSLSRLAYDLENLLSPLLAALLLVVLSFNLLFVLNAAALLLLLWFVLGAGASMVMTPTGRLLKQSCRAEERPALFAAQFSLSHACWLVAYPLAGWLGSVLGMMSAFAVMAVLALAATLLAVRLWPAETTEAFT